MSTAISLGVDISCWMDFMPVHHWMDATKAVHAYIPHRALRHHIEGLEWLCDRKGSDLNYTGGTTPLMPILEQHLREDTSLDTGLPRIIDWLEALQPPEWMPSTLPSLEEMSENSARKYGGQSSDWTALHKWFMEDFNYHQDNRFLSIRNHSFGIFDAEEHFGYLMNGIPVRVIAEQHVKTVMGRIPHTSAWLKCFRLKRWMSPDPVVVSKIKKSIVAVKLIS